MEKAIAGSENIVIVSVDTDGTDGPSFQFSPEGNHLCLSGGIVDDTTTKRYRTPSSV